MLNIFQLKSLFHQFSRLLLLRPKCARTIPVFKSYASFCFSCSREKCKNTVCEIRIQKTLLAQWKKNLIQLNIPDYVKNGMEWN